VAVLALGGGDDNGGGGGGEPARLSKADYEDQASDILRTVSTAATSVSVPQELPNIADDRLKISNDLEGVQQAYTQAAEKLSALRPPADVQDLHDQGVTAIRDLGTDIGNAQAAAEEGNSDAYKAAFESYDAHQDKVAELTQQFADKGYSRLGAQPGNQTGHPLTGEEREVADTVASAQQGFRDKDVQTYCLSRSVDYLDKAYGGSYSFKTCTKAGASGLQAEVPDVLSGGDLTITDVAISKDGKGNEAVVAATGDNGQQVVADVTRKPPSDDVWRVNSFETP
jgi:hypothetical protein